MGREFWMVKLDFDDDGRHILEFTEIDWVVEATQIHIDDSGNPVTFVLLSRSTEETSLRSRVMESGVASPRTTGSPRIKAT